MEIEFPIEFLVIGTPVSIQAKNADSRNEWKSRVLNAAQEAVPQPHFSTDSRLAATLYYFPDGEIEGDIDNIVGLTLDALHPHIYMDDRLIDRVVVQKFEPGHIFPFAAPSSALVAALTREKPLLYIRISDDPFEDLT